MKYATFFLLLSVSPAMAHGAGIAHPHGAEWTIMAIGGVAVLGLATRAIRKEARVRK